LKHYHSFNLTLLDKHNPHPRELLYLSKFDNISTSKLTPLIQTSCDNWRKNILTATASSLFQNPSALRSYEYKKLYNILRTPLPTLLIQDQLSTLPFLINDYIQNSFTTSSFENLLTERDPLNHPLMTKLLSIQQLCWASIELSKFVSNSASITAPYWDILNQLSTINDRLYAYLINKFKVYQNQLPSISEKSITLANALKEELNGFFNDIIMVGVAELENKQFIASFSSSSSSLANNILIDVLKKFPDVIPAIPAPYSLNFKRYIRLKNGLIKFHNGHSCVEPKLMQSAELLGKKINHLAIIRVHETGKRYDLPSNPTVSKACPGCLLNLNAFKIFH
jgi:hypothetical protein